MEESLPTPKQSPAQPFIIGAVIFAALLLAGGYLIPWQNVRWGSIELSPARAVTVTGEAKSQQRTQIAVFTAGVDAVNSKREDAIAEVNKKIATIIDQVKKFGIPETDIQTQNMSLYQDRETYYEDGAQKTRPGQWRVNNTIMVKLRDVDKANDLAALLTAGGATNVYGPNFSLEDTKEAERGLLKEAIEDARKKAEAVAAASGKKLGSIVNVSESGAVPYPIYTSFRTEAGGGGGGGPSLEPGSSTVYKSVVVTFELR